MSVAYAVRSSRIQIIPAMLSLSVVKATAYHSGIIWRRCANLVSQMRRLSGTPDNLRSIRHSCAVKQLIRKNDALRIRKGISLRVPHQGTRKEMPLRFSFHREG